MKTAFDAARQPKRRGDRRDGVYLRDIDAMHKIMPLLYPGRCDNEAYIAETIDLTAVDAYLAQKNASELAKPEDEVFKYTTFHVVVASLLKTLALRPKMNWFIANKKMYAHRELVASFVVKKKFADDGAEALAFIKAEPEDTMETIHEKIRKIVFKSRKGKELDGSSESMDIVSKLPFFLVRFVVWSCRKLDIHGHVPKGFVESDPYYTSVVLSNLGSIKLKSGYHHLTNWGTNSLFCIVGDIKKRPFFNEDGTFEMRNSVELGLTVDERIADGYYYSKSIRLLKKLLENPELLDRPMEEEVEY